MLEVNTQGYTFYVVEEEGYSIYDAYIDCAELPNWWPSDALSLSEIEGIQTGGCAGYAYMPAVVYAEAQAHMHAWGDDILEYIEEQLGDIILPSVYSWSGLASHLLCMAVELFVNTFDIEELKQTLEEAKEDDQEISDIEEQANNKLTIDLPKKVDLEKQIGINLPEITIMENNKFSCDAGLFFKDNVGRWLHSVTLIDAKSFLLAYKAIKKGLC